MPILLWSSAVCQVWFFPWSLSPPPGERCETGTCIILCNLSLKKCCQRMTQWNSDCLNASSCALPTLPDLSEPFLDKGWLWLHRLQSSHTEKWLRIKQTSIRENKPGPKLFFGFVFFHEPMNLWHGARNHSLKWEFWSRSDEFGINPFWQGVSFGRLLSCSPVLSQLIWSVGKGGGALWSFSLENKYLCYLVCFSLDFSQKISKKPHKKSQTGSLKVSKFLRHQKEALQAWHL